MTMESDAEVEVVGLAIDEPDLDIPGDGKKPPAFNLAEAREARTPPDEGPKPPKHTT